MVSGREARALAMQKQQEVDPLNRYVETEEGARDVAALVTATLEEQGMMRECIESMNGGSSSHVHWFAGKHNDALCKSGQLETLPNDCKLFFIYIEDTFKDAPGASLSCRPWSVSIVFEVEGPGGVVLPGEMTWIMNPIERGSEATLDDCRQRLGGPFVFERAYEAMVGALPAGANYSDPAAMTRMTALHAAVIQLPTIEATKTDILRAIAGFERGVHYHGADAHFLKGLGYVKPVVDLGKVIARFLLPVRRRMKAANKGCTLSQSVACLVLKGEWRSPHLSVNDAHMLYSSFEGLINLLDSVRLSCLQASASHLHRSASGAAAFASRPRVPSPRAVPMHLSTCVSDVLTVAGGSTNPADPRRRWRCETGVGCRLPLQQRAAMHTVTGSVRARGRALHERGGASV
jgi:hypothetical protein